MLTVVGMGVVDVSVIGFVQKVEHEEISSGIGKIQGQ
jgi:hypothetical protein